MQQALANFGKIIEIEFGFVTRLNSLCYFDR